MIGVPDPRLGEELMAWVQLTPGIESLSADDVRSFAHGQLATYKIPRYAHVVAEFPMTVSGKIRKVEMRQRAVELLGVQTAQQVAYA